LSVYDKKFDLNKILAQNLGGTKLKKRTGKKKDTVSLEMVFPSPRNPNFLVALPPNDCPPPQHSTLATPL
jgi:hypothetical protein